MLVLPATHPPENSSNKVDPDQPAQNQGQALSFLPVISFGPFELDTEREELYLDGSHIKLSRQPMRVLLKLLEKPNEIVTRDELCQYLWPGQENAVNDYKLPGLVRMLRGVLNDPHTQPRYIETIKGTGYRFIGGVEHSQRQVGHFAGRQLKPKPETNKGIHSQRNFWAVTNSRFISWGAIVALITATVVGFGVTFTWLVTSKPPGVGRFVVVSVLVVAAVSMILATVGAIPLAIHGVGKPRPPD